MPLSVLNSTSDTIPPGAAMEPIGTADVNGLVRIRKPTRNDSQTILVNGLTPILPNTGGVGFLIWEPLLTLGLDPVDLDADGLFAGSAKDWGTLTGSWYFKPGRLGFIPTAAVFMGFLPALPGRSTPNSSLADRLLFECLVTNLSTGAITGIKQTWAKTDGTTYCVVVPSCDAGACPLAWYCTNGVVSSVAAGSPPPTGFTGGPWATELEADAGCPVADILVTCGGKSFSIPGAMYVNFSNITGAAAAVLPNSVRILIDPVTKSSGTISIPGNLPGSFFCFSVTFSCVNELGSDALRIQFTYGCDTQSCAGGLITGVGGSVVLNSWWNSGTNLYYFDGTALTVLASPSQIGSAGGSSGGGMGSCLFGGGSWTTTLSR